MLSDILWFARAVDAELISLISTNMNQLRFLIYVLFNDDSVVRKMGVAKEESIT